jgi:hypothetical protein
MAPHKRGRKISDPALGIDRLKNWFINSLLSGTVRTNEAQPLWGDIETAALN